MKGMPQINPRPGPQPDMRPDIAAARAYLWQLQDDITAALEAVEAAESTAAGGAARFTEDHWHREQGGGGRSRALSGGAVFERAGINFSHVHGVALPAAATAARPQLAGRAFEALGVSVVLHPANPYVPTAHMNVRLLAAQKPAAEPIWWFGGGFDLTPFYPFEEDVLFWHETARAACMPFGAEVYPRCKRQCDEYFYLKHRNETRGVGGLFFDDLNEWGFERCFAFQRSVGSHFIRAYAPIVERRKNHAYGERQRDFQLYRRGRYVEFNLLYDRGTLFGLQSGGRVESIFMSLPPQVRFRYNWRPRPGSEEARLYERYLQPQDWLGVGPGTG